MPSNIRRGAHLWALAPALLLAACAQAPLASGPAVQPSTAGLPGLQLRRRWNRATWAETGRSPGSPALRG